MSAPRTKRPALKRALAAAASKPGALVADIRQMIEVARQQVAQAVNDAPPGRVIVDSEEQVRDLLGEFRRSAYQAALQLRVDAAEAAFSPGGSGDKQAQGRQRAQRSSDSVRERAGLD